MSEREYVELVNALRNWPRLPRPRTLRTLSGAARFPEDWETGKKMQRELEPERIPGKTECEKGAGFWDRITGGKWRECEPPTTGE